jgi:hypothetical protein
VETAAVDISLYSKSILVARNPRRFPCHQRARSAQQEETLGLRSSPAAF